MAGSLNGFATLGRKIICVGRNYKAHAIELGNAIPTVPLLFMKPVSAYATEGQLLKFADGSKELHHEVELAVIIGRRASRISKHEAMAYVGGYALALDNTARDFQFGKFFRFGANLAPERVSAFARFLLAPLINLAKIRPVCDLIEGKDIGNFFESEAKKAGAPWLLAKGFDTSCPISAFIDKSLVQDPHNLQLWCSVNDVLRQRGNTSDMIFRIPDLLEYISKFITLDRGDAILTGTPEGVGPLMPGDVVKSGLVDNQTSKELVTMRFTVAG